MNHKRKRPKNRRGGCLFCKPHKANHAPKGGDKDKQHARKLAAKGEIAEAL